MVNLLVQGISEKGKISNPERAGRLRPKIKKMRNKSNL